ncbi:hypothetical protein DMUE_5074 [Dictyocoela muelleri]|nr:hypothetical protein DMUE_5074 [Dictyocoela muelleri]
MNILFIIKHVLNANPLHDDMRNEPMEKNLIQHTDEFPTHLCEPNISDENFNYGNLDSFDLDILDNLDILDSNYLDLDNLDFLDLYILCSDILSSDNLFSDILKNSSTNEFNYSEILNIIDNECLSKANNNTINDILINPRHNIPDIRQSSEIDNKEDRENIKFNPNHNLDISYHEQDDKGSSFLFNNDNNFTENLNNISNFIENPPFKQQIGSIKPLYSSQDTEIFYENLEQIDDQRIVNDTNEDTLSNLISKILSRCNNYPKINLFSGDVTENDKKQTNNENLAFNNLLNDNLIRKISENKSKHNPIVQDLQNYPTDLNRIDENDKSIYSLKETKRVENNQIENLDEFKVQNKILGNKIKNFTIINEKSNCQFDEIKNFGGINDNSIENVKYREYFQGNIKFQHIKTTRTEIYQVILIGQIF